MERTELLDLPYILPSQAQKSVTHNEALRALDALVQLAVRDDSLTAPPVAPVAGDRYIVAEPASGEWSGHEGEIAAYQDGAWAFYLPLDGWLAHVAASNRMRLRRDAAWTDMPAPSALADVEQLGVNASASATNRLTVSAAATLLTAETDDHRLVVNKTGEADTATLLFQSGYSGRAEMGLAGNDAMSFKVSPDGATWSEPMVLTPSGARLGTTTQAALPSPGVAGAGSLAVIGDGPGGATIVFSDGTDWRSVTLGPAL